MTEDILFIRQAVESLVATSQNIANTDPTIRELLKRVKYNSPINIDIETSEGTIVSSSRHDLKFVTPRETLSSDPADTLSFPSSSFTSSSEDTTVDSSLHSEAPTHFEMMNNGHFPSENDHEHPIYHRHRGGKAGDPEETYACVKCDLVFLRVADLKRHEKAHSLTLPHICSRCGKGFARKDALKRHANTLTCNRNRKKLMEVAGKDFEQVIERAQREGISI